MQIVIRGNTVATVYSVPQSLTEPATVNLWPYINYFNVNSSTDIVLRFTDSYGNQKSVTYNNYFTYIDMHINVNSAQLGTKTSTNIVVPLYLFGPSYTAMAERYVCYRLTRPDSAVPDVAELSEKTVANGNAYNLNLALGQYAQEGTYQLDVWMKGKMSETDEEYIYSEERHLTFIYTSPDSNTPYISVEWENTNYVARKNGTLVYLVAYHMTDNSSVTVQIFKDGGEEPYYSRQELVQHGEPNNFSYKFVEPGVYTARVVWNNNTTVFGQTSFGTVVAPASNVNIPTTYTSGLQVNLSAQGRSNNEIERNTWTSSVNNIDVTCTMSNFNWSTNGWFVDENGDGYLHMTNGANLVVNFPIYSTQYTTGGKDPMRNGKAIEIDFRISNVRDSNAILMRAASNKDTGVINNGIICQGDKICINTSGKRNYYTPEEELTITDTERASTAGLRAYLTEDRRIHIAFDIEGSDNTGSYNGERIKPMIYTFIDGVISGLTQVELNDTIADTNPENPSKLTITSDNADIDIYNIRIYEGFLTEQVIRNNFIADYADDSIQEALTEANDLLNSDNLIDFDKVKEAAHIPYMVIKDLGATDSKKGEAAYDQSDGQSRLTYGKKDFRGVSVYFVDPFDPSPDGKYQIGSEENPVDAVIYGQGTSSMAYPVKNLRIRFKNMKYSLKYSPDGGQTYANFPGVKLFTLKADYMDSSMAHNTGTGNILSALYDTPNVKLKTPAQDYFTSKTITNNIVGFPMLIFFQRYTDEPGTKPEYIGRYNFNLDKGEPDLFGFSAVREEGKNYGVLTTQIRQNGKVTYAGDLKNGFTAVAAKNADAFKPDTEDYYIRPITNNPQTVAARGDFTGIDTPLGYNELIELRDQAIVVSRNTNILRNPSEEELAIINKIDNDEIVEDNEYEELGYNRNNFTNVYNNYKIKLFVEEYGITANNVSSAIASLNAALTNFSIGQMTIFSKHGTENQKTGAQLLAQAKIGTVYKEIAGPGTIQCWEFLNNSYDLCGFRMSWDEIGDFNHKDKEKGMPFEYWRQAFESRYPEFEQNDVDADRRAFAAFVNWVASTDQTKVRDPRDQVPLAQPYEADGVIYENDTPEYRLAKFKAEAADHMEIPFVAFYYVVTETLLAIDNRGKNMMMACFDADNDAGTGHWFPIFYDMDTILGVNNVGTLKFQYYAEDTDTQVFNANASYYTEQGQIEVNYSTLWCNFRQAFQEEIKNMYINLHKGQLNYNGLVAWYNDRQADAFQMVEINKDHEYKYIRPITTPAAVTENGELKIKTYNGTNAAQGTRSLHRDYWLNRRFNFLTSKYPDMRDTSTADIYYRAFAAGSSTVPANMHYAFQTSAVQYADYSYGTSAHAPVIKVRPGEIVDGPPIANLKANEQECYLFNLGSIYDIGDLSTKYPSQFTVSRPIKLTHLRLGNRTPGYKNENLDMSSVSTSLGNLPLLSYLDITNTSLRGHISLESNQYINEVYAKGSDITNLSFARGGSLRKLVLPKGYDTLVLLYNTINTVEDYEFAPNNDEKRVLSFENIRDLRYLGVEACPDLDTKSLLKEIIRAKREDITYVEDNITKHTTLDEGIETTNTYDKLFTAFRMTDINWRLDDTDLEEVSLNNGYVKDIPILHYLSYCRQGFENDYTTRIIKQKANNLYLGGQIVIENSHHPIDEYSISARYSQLFPNLRITWTHNNGNLHGYHLNFMDDNGYQITGSITNEEITNSIVYGITDLETLNLTEYIKNHTNVPADLQTSNGQYTQVFRGWTLEEPKHTNDEIELRNWLNSGIEVIYDEHGNITNVINNIKTNLTASDFITEDQLFNLYPIREDVIRYYEVTFHRYKEGSQQAIDDIEHDIIPVNIGTPTNPNYVNTQFVMWGTKAIMPEDEPTNMVLNNDGTTSVYPFDRYTYDAINQVIKAKLDNYPIFREGADDVLDAKDAPSPMSMFDVSPVDNVPNIIGSGLSNGVCLTLKSGIFAPSVTVPATYEGAPVYQFKLPRNVEMQRLKRIYFQNGVNDSYHPIKIISTNVNSHTSVATNRVLEYIDFTNTSLNMISAYTFAYAPNLKLINKHLPGTIKLIEQYAFAQKDTLGSSIDFSILPYALTEIGSYAFYNCTSLTSVDFGSATQLTNINSHAFNGCTSLHSPIDIGNSDCLAEVRIVGDYAFYNCSELTLYKNHTYENYQSNMTYIGKHAFDKCSKLYFKAELRYIQTIDDYAFANCGTDLQIAQISNTLTNVGARIFENDALERITNGMFYTDNKKFTAWTQTADGSDVISHGMHPDAFGGLAQGFKFQYFYILYGGVAQGDPPQILDRTAAPWNGYMDANGEPMYYRCLENGVYKYYAADAEDLPASGIEPCTRWGATGHFTNDEYWIAFGQ